MSKSTDPELSEVQSELQTASIDNEDFEAVNFSLKHWTDTHHEDLKALLLCLQEAQYVLSSAEHTMVKLSFLY